MPINQSKHKDKTDNNKKTFLRALESALGVVTLAAQKTGLARSQHYKWLSEDAQYEAQVKEVENMAIDFAESQLHKRIANGDTTATIFYLKTKGKKRGYIERVELDVEQVGNITRPSIKLPDGTLIEI